MASELPVISSHALPSEGHAAESRTSRGLDATNGSTALPGALPERRDLARPRCPLQRGFVCQADCPPCTGRPLALVVAKVPRHRPAKDAHKEIMVREFCPLNAI